MSKNTKTARQMAARRLIASSRNKTWSGKLAAAHDAADLYRVAGDDAGLGEAELRIQILLTHRDYYREMSGR